jgi:CBS domain-containing protein
MGTTVRDVMTTKVVALRRDAGYKEIVAALRRCRVSAFPVLDSANRVIGVVSEADLLLKETHPDQPTEADMQAGQLPEIFRAAGVTALELMTTPAITIGPDAPLAEAASLMRERRVKRLPVVEPSGRLVGIVSRADVLSVFERPDEQIWDEVVSLAASVLGLDAGTLKVTVRGGIVTMTGVIDARANVLHLIDVVCHVEGVIAVRDRLSYPDDAERPLSADASA